MWLLGRSKVRVSATGMGQSPAKRCPSPKPINGMERCTHQSSSYSSTNIGQCSWMPGPVGTQHHRIYSKPNKTPRPRGKKRERAQRGSPW